MTMSQQPVRIIGAGIGGLTLGRCLLKYGIPAVIYDRLPSAALHNYGVTLHASSYIPLVDILGLDEFTFRRRLAVDESLGGSGNINPKSLIYPGKLSSTSFRAHRGKLEALLREGLDVQWGHSLEEVKDTPSGMILCLQNGHKVESACIIGADGPHSNTRKSLSPDTPSHVLPYVAFNGKRQVERVLFDRVYAPAFQGTSIIERKHGDVVLNIAINGEQGGAVSMNWIFSRPVRGSSDALYKPDRPVSGATDIPEEFFKEIATLHGLSQPFREIFDAEKMRTDRILHWLMRTVLVKRRELRALADRGVFFMGDSVHAEPILGGQGANSAIVDGVELAKCISACGSGGIASWYESRYPMWEKESSESEEAIAMMHGV